MINFLLLFFPKDLVVALLPQDYGPKVATIRSSFVHKSGREVA